MVTGEPTGYPLDHNSPTTRWVLSHDRQGCFRTGGMTSLCLTPHYCNSARFADVQQPLMFLPGMPQKEQKNELDSNGLLITTERGAHGVPARGPASEGSRVRTRRSCARGLYCRSRADKRPGGEGVHTEGEAQEQRTSHQSPHRLMTADDAD